jgi:phospholipid transport system substrate-binding protein
MHRRDLLVLLPTAMLASRVEAEESGPAAPIQALDQALLQIMRAGASTPFIQRAQMLRPAVERAFNLQQILETSVGPKWRSIPPARQQELLRLFSEYTVDSYVANFNSYSGQRIEVLPHTRTVGADVIVETQIVPANGDEPTRIDYVMRRFPQGWQAVDVLLNGSISRVAVQRSDFRALVGSDGSALLESLRKKVAALQSGAAT